MGLKTVDLNLLRPLLALLEEESVTGAARREGVSQPAMSASLAKLRRQFDDPLLVRNGNRYRRTALADELRPQVEQALATALSALAGPAHFEPRNLERDFQLLASDYAIAMIGAALAGAVREAAPRARVVLSQFDAATTASNPRVLERADGLLLPHGFIADYPCVDVFSDGYSCLVSTDHPNVADVLTLDDMRRERWVTTYRESWLSTAAERQLRMQGVELRSGLVADSFLSLPFLVAESDMLALVPTRLASRVVRGGSLKVLECPVSLTGIREALWWRDSLTDDPAHTWFRRIVTSVGASLGS